VTEIGIFQIILYLLVLFALVKPLGLYMERVYQGKSSGLNFLLQPLENLIYRLCGIDTKKEMNWVNYLSSMLFFNFLSFLLAYSVQRLQFYLPLNPQNFPGVSPDSAFNTGTSFVTNTDWQAYSGETTMSYLTQMLAMTSQNFFSAATGMSLLMALIRGITRHEAKYLGNFWADIVRGVLYILLPLSILLSIILISQGVIQNFHSYQKVPFVEPITYQESSTEAGQNKTVTKTATEQVIPMGPVASQTAIMQLGTNGGGFFNTNSSHPFQNPTPLTNFLETLALLIIPASFCYTFGILVNDKRQGWAILAAMFLIFIPLLFTCVISEQVGNPAFKSLHIDQIPKKNLYPGGNMEGKETRFGIVSSAIWSAATTASSNGSVNSMLDSYTPLGGLIPLWLMHLGEVVFGGVGSGLTGMLMLIIITVFVSGLMVGRTPEYLGKKIEPYEMKMASIAVLIMPMTVLIFTAIASVTKSGTSSIFNPGTHGFTEMLYAFTSMVNNNGSAFAGLNGNTFFYNVLGGIAILIGRYWIAIPSLAIAGSLVIKKKIPASSGTLPTHSLLFIVLLISVTIVLGALTFFPALALGPIVDQIMLWGKYGY
jgi:potassium-transporting ATPase potassium-binding subunit